ncbi:MAG: hypothetical protein IKB65_06235, partial [Ruminiclostridium sp.]|nr:hypothetical protein [Ruminiclostridium sp.]
LGGLGFVMVKMALGRKTRFLAPVLFICGYGLLLLGDGWAWVIGGSALIGFANGMGIPFIISSGARKAGVEAATTVMPMISMGLYCAQFLTPMLLSVIGSLFAWVPVLHLPYAAALVSGLVFLAWSARIKS